MTGLVAAASPCVRSAALGLVTWREESKRHALAPLPYATWVAVQGGGYEDVSVLYGVALPLAAEWSCTGRCESVEGLLRSRRFPDFVALAVVTLHKAGAGGGGAPEWLRLAALILALRGEPSRMERLNVASSSFAWANREVFDEALRRLLLILPAGGTFEALVECHLASGLHVHGRMDWAASSIVEVKFCSSLRPEHQLQAAVYAAVRACDQGAPCICKLVNVRDDAVLECEADPQAGAELLEMLWTSQNSGGGPRLSP